MSEEIKLIRLTTGEELVTQVRRSRDELYIKNPAILIPTEDRQLTLSPFMPYAKVQEEETHLRDNGIMFIVSVSDQLEDYYRQMFSSVITPKKQSIIT